MFACSGLNCEDHGCNAGSLAQGWGSGTARYPYLITVSYFIYIKLFSTNQKHSPSMVFVTEQEMPWK